MELPISRIAAATWKWRDDMLSMPANMGVKRAHSCRETRQEHARGARLSSASWSEIRSDESRFRSKYLFGRIILSEKSATFRDHALVEWI
jgi:hypothetical protein